MFIQTFPPLFISLVIATRAASIWLLVIQADSKETRPYSPYTILLPFVALPFILPLCCFLLFTLLGINILVITSFPCFGEYLTFVNPNLNAYHSICGFSFRKSIIYVGS